MQIRLVPTNLRNQPVGEHAFRAYPDSFVDRARALRAQGWTFAAISAELGPHASTISRWLSGITRKPPARVIARRVQSK